METSCEQDKLDIAQNSGMPKCPANTTTRPPQVYNIPTVKENIRRRKRSSILLKTVHGSSIVPQSVQGDEITSTSILAEFIDRKRKNEDVQAGVVCAAEKVRQGDASIKLYSLLKDRAREKLRSTTTGVPRSSFETKEDIEL